MATFVTSSSSGLGYSTAKMTSIGTIASFSHQRSGESTQYGVVMHGTINCNGRCDAGCLPVRMKHMPTSIHVPSMLLMDLAWFILPCGCLEFLEHPPSFQDWRRVHSPCEYESMVSYVPVSILTTFRSPSPWQFGSSGAQHLVELSSLQSGWHASNSSPWNPIPLNNGLLSLDHLPHIYVYLKITISFDETNQRVNGILLWPGLEASIQF